MSTQITHPGPVGIPAGLLKIKTFEVTIQERVEAERKRLLAKEGIESAHVSRFARPVENPFTKDQRDRTVLLFGGLTWKHEKLIHGALEGLGYKCEAIPTPDVKAFQLGKEYGNNGQCNPTYFTVGNLVQFLQGLEAKGMSREDIIGSYVFLTAGACGPCRFGMYEAEYRLALRNSGFDGFRVMLFQQSAGLNQEEAEAGLEMSLDFFLGILNAMNMGDVINDVAYQIRPYEVNKGETDRVLIECMDLMHEVLKKHRPFDLRETSPLLSKVLGNGGQLGKFINQLVSDEYTAALRQVRDRFNAIPIDYTRVKPIVKITGEFWAQTTEGDGNFNIFPFLEREGAQVLVEPIGTWILYMIHQFKQRLVDYKGLEDGHTDAEGRSLRQRLHVEINARKRVARMTLAEKIFSREYNRIREALGGTSHELADQYEMQRLGHPYYNSRSGGGEGHLEVAKNIYYHNKNLAHMVLSLKPFGCMPSTQSDGAQSAVVSQFKDMIYLPIETSGEGEINAHSRVQMALGEAKFKAKNEFKAALESTGYSIEQVRAYMNSRPELQRPLQHLPHFKGIVGTAARFVKHVGERMRKDRVPARSSGEMTPALAAQ